MRPTQIIKSETKVQDVMTVLEREYIYPFGENVDQDKLVHISSGVHVDNKVADTILNVIYFKTGKKLADTFRENRLLNKTVKLHALIS